MANSFIVPAIVAKESLRILENNLVTSRVVYRSYENEYYGAKKGDTITIRKPATFIANEFTSTISTQDVTETSTSITLEKLFDVSVEVTSKQLTLDLQSFSAQVIAPAMAALAQAVDEYVLSQYVDVYNYVGAAGSPPDSLAEVAAVDKLMNELKAPMNNRFAVVSPAAKAALFNIDSFARLDTRGQAGLNALERAEMGMFMNSMWMMDQNVATSCAHTAGTANTLADILTNGVQAVGATSVVLDSAGGTTETFKKGDVITIAGEGQHVVTADAAMVAGAATIAISPALRSEVADGVAITVVGDHVSNLIAVPQAIALASVPLMTIGENDERMAVSSFNNLSVRVVADYSITKKSSLFSFDTLVGAKVIDPRICARILG